MVVHNDSVNTQAIWRLAFASEIRILLPNESHAYRARESITHMLYETNSWLDKYVKNARP